MNGRAKIMLRITLLVALAGVLVAYLSGAIPGSAFGNRGDDEPGEQTMDIVLYFGDLEAILTGTPGEFGMVKPVVRSIAHNPNTLSAVLQELIGGPQEDEDGERTVPAALDILDVIVDDGVATIDVSQSIMTAPDKPAGTLGGSVFVQSLVWTATEIAGIDAVVLTVEGEPFDDGHFIWDEPLGRAVLEDRGADDPGEKTVDIILYFGDLEAILTGTPGEFGMVKPVVRTIAHTPDMLSAALGELIIGPQGEEGGERTVPATLDILDVTVFDGVATIDVSQSIVTAPDKPAGTLGGSVFVQSLVWTVTEIAGIDAVVLTVEGEPFDDGHFIWDEPLGRVESPQG